MLAALLLVGLLGLIGLPPTVGFTGKWFLFSAAIAQGQFALVLVAAVNSAVALYYYLLVMRQAYFAPAEDEAPLRAGGASLAAAAAATVVVLAMGAAPGWFWDRSAEAVAALLR